MLCVLIYRAILYTVYTYIYIKLCVHINIYMVPPGVDTRLATTGLHGLTLGTRPPRLVVKYFCVQTRKIITLGCQNLKTIAQRELKVAVS